MILTRSARGSRTGILFIAGLLVQALLPTRSATATTAWRAELSTGGGYDDDVLGRPGENSSFPILSTSYLSLAPTLWGLWAPGSWSMTGSWNYVLNAYEKEEAGLYQDSNGRVGIGFRPAPGIQLRVDGEAEWFHRTEFQDYDFNRQEVAPSAIWQISEPWSLQASWLSARVTYPEQTTPPVNGETQVDEPEELGLSLGFSPDESWEISAGVATLSVGSNSRQYEYDGDRISVGVTGNLGRDWTVGAHLDRERRDYSRFLYANQLPSGAVRPAVGREDVSILVDLDIQHRMTESARLFAGFSFLDYGSTVDDYEFDRTRWSGGLILSFGGTSAVAPGVWDPGTFGMTAAVRNPLQPVVGTDGVTFRCRAPGATSVQLVGSMNDWTPGTHPLSGPTSEGIWETSLKLEPGLYRYIFLVDTTEWRTPEGAPLYEDDDFGQRNGVLDVSASVTSGAGGGPTTVTNPR